MGNQKQRDVLSFSPDKVKDKPVPDDYSQTEINYSFQVREQARAGPKRDAIQVDPELSDFAISLYRELKFLGFAWDDTFVEDVLETAAEVAL
ncbi:hypothetical protein [Candidatus Hakubella thermalkaliphila]|uniref:hypothetical protein n=1 Tax=Candidatus Hakubella thermalkaliphila TaxID=2754717 RepID=UPI001592FEDE|nr:hypothetical protein [Candidatus Hakubella thermalkaliphila]